MSGRTHAFILVSTWRPSEINVQGWESMGQRTKRMWKEMAMANFLIQESRQMIGSTFVRTEKREMWADNGGSLEIGLPLQCFRISEVEVPGPSEGASRERWKWEMWWNVSQKVQLTLTPPQLSAARVYLSHCGFFEQVLTFWPLQNPSESPYICLASI